MQVLRPIPGGIRRSADGNILLLPFLGARCWVVAYAGAVLGAYIGVGRVAGIPGCWVAGCGMCEWLSLRLLR